MGIVNVRQLASLDADSGMTLNDLISEHGRIQGHLFCVFENTRLDYMLKAFREGEYKVQ